MLAGALKKPSACCHTLELACRSRALIVYPMTVALSETPCRQISAAFVDMLGVPLRGLPAPSGPSAQSAGRACGHRRDCKCTLSARCPRRQAVSS